MKVVCSGVWDHEYTNREGKIVKVVCVRLSVPTKTGMYEYPYPFQLPVGSSRPQIMGAYEVDFSFGFYLKEVERPDSSGELVKVKEQYPTWRIASIAPAK